MQILEKPDQFEYYHHNLVLWKSNKPSVAPLSKIMILNSETFARAFVGLVFVFSDAQNPGGIALNLTGFVLFLIAIGYFLFTGSLFGKNSKKISYHE